MAIIKIGDVIEISTKVGFAYAQYSHQHSMYGALIRVFKTKYPKRPDQLNQVLNDELQFSIFFPLKAAVDKKIVQVVANFELECTLQKFPLFRAGVIDPVSKKVKTWWLWDGKNETEVGTLSKEQRKFPIRGVWNDTLLIERIEAGWTPETDPL